MEKITCIKGKTWCGPKKKEWEVSVIHKSFVTSVLALASLAFQLVWIIRALEFSNQWQTERREMKTKRAKLLLFQVGPSHGRNSRLLEMRLARLRVWIGISHFGAPWRKRTLFECERFQGVGHRLWRLCKLCLVEALAQTEEAALTAGAWGWDRGRAP